ncbi:unnamed protein product [Dicrocoelium dendriticum]|nr:unnamed protein product [Dicrocoelium dendriticum]
MCVCARAQSTAVTLASATTPTTAAAFAWLWNARLCSGTHERWFVSEANSPHPRGYVGGVVTAQPERFKLKGNCISATALYVGLRSANVVYHRKRGCFSHPFDHFK